MKRSNAKRAAIALSAAVLSLPMSSMAGEVDIYGQANVALYYNNPKNGSDSLIMQNESSRIGFRATENLTSETSINVHLETGFNIDTGALTQNGGNNVGTTLFDRRSFISVKNLHYGEFAFGRMGTVRSTMAPFGYTLGMLDPFGTMYGPDGTISAVFGNDTRANNTVTYLSPSMAGFSVGLSYSLATYDNENEDSSKNNRHLAGMVNYRNGPLYLVLSATQAWYGKDSGGSDKVTYDRKDSQAYTFGGFYNFTPNFRVYAAAQYNHNFRNVAGWNLDSSKFKFNTDADRYNGVDGVSALLGMTWRIGSWNLIADYLYFDGDHELADGTKQDGSRYILNGAVEYYLSKRTRLMASLHWSEGADALGSTEIVSQGGTDLTRLGARLGMIHYF